jgi:hypothetical protein
MATGEMVVAGTPSEDLCGRKGTGSGAVARGLVMKPIPLFPSPRMAQTQFSLHMWLAKPPLGRGYPCRAMVIFRFFLYMRDT